MVNKGSCLVYILGNWLFCSEKPPKTEKEGHESTHNQRAHVKLNRLDMFGKESEISKGCLDISEDDKAYVRPGTDDRYCLIYPYVSTANHFWFD